MKWQPGKIGKETAWAGLTKGCTLLLFIAANALLARALGRDGYGAWSYFFSALSIFYLLSLLGINDSMRIFVARQRAAGYRTALRAGFQLRVAASLIFGLALVAIGPAMAGALGRPEFGTLFQWGAVFLVLQGCVEYLKSAYEGLHRIRYNFILNILEYGGKLVLIGLLAFSAVSLLQVLAALSLANALACAVGFYLLYTQFYRKDPRSAAVLDSEGGGPSAIARYAMPMFMLATGYMIATELDTLMLGLLSTDAEVGKYAPAKQLCGRLPHFSAFLAMGTLQVFAAPKPGDAPRLRKLALRLVALVALVYGAVCLFILLFANSFVPLIFGQEFTSTAESLRLLTPHILIYGIARILSGILDYQGKAWRRALYLGIATLLNIVLNLALIPRYGANGAAIATSLAYVPYLVLLAWELWRWLQAKANQGDSTAAAH